MVGRIVVEGDVGRFKELFKEYDVEVVGYTTDTKFEKSDVLYTNNTSLGLDAAYECSVYRITSDEEIVRKFTKLL